MTLRGIRTLQPRIRQHEESASLIAQLLDDHALVERVYYPGLKTHPGHDIAKRQQRGFGGMISFELSGGTHAVRTFVEHLRYFSLAESLGGVESLVCHPLSMTHAPLDDKALAKAGITPNLVRLSIGLESSEDLAADLLSALNASAAQPTLKPVAAAIA
jgi:cystathionine gamma-synthase